jgi:hypothetical protein
MFKMNYTKGVHFDDFNDILNDISSEDIDSDLLCKANKRKAQPVYSGVLKYFPDALKEVSKASKAGNDQHHPNKPLHWDKTKSFDNEDALVRHLIDHSLNPMDDDGVLHLAKVAWRALASLQIYLENNK